MSEEKKKAPVLFRVTIRPRTQEVLENWRQQIQKVHSSFKSSDRQLVEWAVERQNELSKRDIQNIKDRFFDEVKELEQIVTQLREAQARGSNYLVNELLASLPKLRKTPLKKPIKVTDNIE